MNGIIGKNVLPLPVYITIMRNWCRSLRGPKMRVMKVYCPECGEAAIIRKTYRKDKKLSDLYCACTDVECGHTFVMNMTFSHTISPSAKTGSRLVQSILSLLRPEDKQMALDLLQGNAI